MNATVQYAMRFVAHPWSQEQKSKGVYVWALVKVTTPEFGGATEEAVALFDLDSEAKTFQGHVFASGLDGTLIHIDPDMAEFFTLRKERR